MIGKKFPQERVQILESDLIRRHYKHFVEKSQISKNYRLHAKHPIGKVPVRYPIPLSCSFELFYNTLKTDLFSFTFCMKMIKVMDHEQPMQNALSLFRSVTVSFNQKKP